MRQLLRRGVVALCAAALVGCTSLRTVLDTSAARTSPAAPASPLAAGEEVTVSTAAGWQSRLRISAVTASSIDGTQVDSNLAEHIELADVAKIERREFSGIKTVFLVLSIYAVLYAIAVAAATAALASNI
jgi:hypothetical protein